MIVNIDDFLVSQTAVTLEVRIVDTSDSMATLYYALRDDFGNMVEEGNWVVPIAQVCALGADPVDIPTLNAEILAAFGITATSPWTPTTTTTTTV